MKLRSGPLGLLSKLAPVALGLAAGLGGAFAGSRVWNTNTSHSVPSHGPPGEDADVTSVRQASAAGRALVEAALAATPRVSDQPNSMRSPQEEAEQRLEVYRGAIAAHRGESVDGAWAPEARTSVMSALKTIEKTRGFSVREVDCRRNSCVADVEFRSPNDARSGYRDLLHGRYAGLNCASEIHMPTSAEAGPIKGELLLSNCR